MAAEKKGRLSTSDQVISPRGGASHGGGALFPPLKRRYDGWRPSGQIAPRRAPGSLPAVIYDMFICPLSRRRGLNYAATTVNPGAHGAVSIMEVYMEVASD